MRTPFIILIIVAFIVTSLGPIAHADEFVLPKPGVMVHLSPEFNPPVLKGIKVHPDNPFRFDFILDKGDSKLANQELKDESTKLIKYFLASLTIPEKDLWVNLSPYEKDRIVPESFGQTEMGRDLLAEDYMLKQITASLIYPEDEVGKKFWKRIYEEAQAKFHTTNIPVNTFNKVWIVPEKAVVYENAKAGTAYVVESKLKVMLEQDYLSLSKHEGIQSQQAQVKDANQIGSQIVREIVIPELTKEINNNKNFTQLRQVYNSLILATWYKKKIKDSILSQVYADKNKIQGVNINDPQEKEKIYQQYLQAFKNGAYNYIKEEINPITQESVPRKYFSGGALLKTDLAMTTVAPIQSSDAAMILNVRLDAARSDAAMNVTGAQTDLPNFTSRDPLSSALKALSELKEGRLNDYPELLHWQNIIWPKIVASKNPRYENRKLNIEEYRQGFEAIRGKIPHVQGRMLHPYGGVNPKAAFFLAPEITDLISLSAKGFGPESDIGKFFGNVSQENDINAEIQRNLYQQMGGDVFGIGFGDFDTEGALSAPNGNSLEGLGARAIARIISDLQGQVKAIHYFDIDPDGEINFDTSKRESAVVVFEKDGIERRFWYINHYIEDGFDSLENSSGRLEFLKRIKVDALLLKGAPSNLLEGIIGINSFRHFLNGIIAKNIPVFCDRRINHLGGNFHSEISQPIFKEPPVVIPLKKFGYGNELYYSLSSNLVTPNVTPSHIPGHFAYTPEIYWMKDGEEKLYYVGYPQLPVGIREALPGTSLYTRTVKDDRMILNNGVEISLGKGYCVVSKGRGAGLLLKNVDRITLDWGEAQQTLLVEFFDDLNGRWEQGVFDLSKERLQLQVLKHLEYADGTLEVKRDVGVYRYQFPPKEWVGKDVVVTTKDGEVIKGLNLQFNPIDVNNSIILNVDGRTKTFWYDIREIRLAANHDNAMFSDPLGGIDFNSDKWKLQTRNEGEGIKFNLDPAMLQQFQNTSGFIPVIINIQPMTNIREFLGLSVHEPAALASR